jgi:mannitol/fructose-specific phosphotransferase system IIA component (Ntr-type)
MSTVLVPSVVDPSLYIPDLRPKRKESILHELVHAAARAGAVRDPALLSETLLRRERFCGSAIGKGVAVPAARSFAVLEPRLFVARCRRGIDWGAPDGLRVHLVLLALSPPDSSEDAHHDLLARAVAMTRLQRSRQKLIDAEGVESVAALLREGVS